MIRVITVRLIFFLLVSYILSSCTGFDNQADPGTSENIRHPNFLLIVADDMGYSDIGAYGGEIDTPNLNQLAKDGVQFTNFYVAPTCSPTRAMLLTGNDSHVAGLGTMVEALRPEQHGKPGYEGYLNQSVATIAERLQDEGYHTSMAGKWHLGGKPEQIPARRGFDHSFALINGAANYYGYDQDGAWTDTLFAAKYFEHTQQASLPEGVYTSDYFTTRLIDFLQLNNFGNEKPFFAYLAFNAPHTPLQAPSDLIEKYRGQYNEGPEALRALRLEQLVKLNLIPGNIKTRPMTDIPVWSSLSASEQIASARRMEVYAAAIDRLDQNVGRVLDALRESGQLENTIIIFLSDNGTEGTDEDIWLSFLEHLGLPKKIVKSVRSSNQEIKQVGSSESYAAYGPGWAQASMTPFSLTKGFITEGGIRTPLVISGPGITNSKITHAFAHVTDIVPTILDLANIKVNPVIKGQPRLAPQGLSFKAQLIEQSQGISSDSRSAAGWELFGRRAIRAGSWKAIYMNNPSVKDGSGSGSARWSLYNLQEDPGETTDLSTEKPDILKELIVMWMTYADKNGVVPVPPIETRIPTQRNHSAAER